jgi:hypothetical protein
MRVFSTGVSGRDVILYFTIQELQISESTDLINKDMNVDFVVVGPTKDPHVCTRATGRLEPALFCGLV